MNNILETEISVTWQDLAKKKDEMLFAAFEKYGYSREWLMSPDNCCRILCCSNVNDPDVTIWAVDNQPLFELIEKFEWNGLKMKVDISIRYIEEKEEANNE